MYRTICCSMSKIYLTITPFFPTLDSFRGPYVFDQVKSIERTGKYRVVVLKPSPFYLSEGDYEYEGIKVYRFQTFDLPSGILPGLFKKLSSVSLYNKLKEIGIDLNDVKVVHAHVNSLGFYANEIKKQAPHVKTIVQHHGFDVLSLENGIFSRFKWHRNWVRNFGVKICNKIDLHVGVSKKTLEYVEAYPEIKMKEQYVLYNGVDTKKFYPKYGLMDPSFFTIGCIGNFWPLKDQITLIKAVERLINDGIKNLRIIFVGSGVTLETCKDYIDRQGIRNHIVFKKEVFHHELLNFYNALDLFVLPSYYEAFGCVYAEAYACGIPFMGIKGQGIAELLPDEDKHKWLVEKGDDRQLALNINEYIKKRWDQKLECPIDINGLVKRFLKYLDSE